MNLTPDRQGYLGDLMTKTIPQLKELLERQETLLAKKKFVETLPDRGEKTRNFAELLKQTIELKSDHPKPSATLTKKYMIKHMVSMSSSSLEDSTDLSDLPDRQILQSLAKRDESKVHYSSIDNNEMLPDATEIDNSGKDIALISVLEQMTISDGSSSQDKVELPQFINSYERVIKKVEMNPVKTKPKFMPNRTLLNISIPPSPYGHHKENTTNTEVKNEESAAKPPKYKFQESKLISIGESVKLIQMQKVKNEELIAERAAQKLAEQLVPKMEIYHPQNVDMRYRENNRDKRDQDSDDDDDNDDEDY